MVVQLIYNNRLDSEVHRLALSYDLALKAESLDTQILTVVSSLRGYELTGTETNLTALEAAKKRAYELNDEMIACSTSCSRKSSSLASLNVNWSTRASTT